MPGFRLLIIVIAVALLVLIVKRLMHQRPAAKPPQTASGNMVRCAHCGLYLPKEDALQQGQDNFCSADHRDRHGQD